MFPIVTALTIVPVLFVGYLDYRSFAELLVGSFFLGVGGSTFAVGVPFANAWFPPERCGAAIGIFGMGVGGTAIRALTTVKLVKRHGIHTPFVLVAIVLGGYAVAAFLVVRRCAGPRSTDRVGGGAGFGHI